MMVQSRVETKNESGFTLIEVLVAVFIGLIVMAMAVAILGATNSTSLRVLAKSEIQQNSRDAMLKIFNEAADAESLDVCRVGIDKETQDKIIAPFSEPGQAGIDINKCKETTSSGFVVAWASPNQMCYFKTKKTNITTVTTTPVISSDPPKILCVTRGGGGRSWDYETNASATVGDKTKSPKDGTNLTACLDFPDGTSPHQIFTYECTPGAATLGIASSINWPKTYGAPSEKRLISDLGANISEDPKVNLFNYTLDDGTKHSSVIGEDDLKSIVAADVNLRGKYRTGVANEVSDYFFEYTIIFRGSQLAQEERANEY